MKCETVRASLIEFCEHALDEQHTAAIENHISECALCCEEMRGITGTLSQLESFRENEKSIHVHASFLVRVNQAIDTKAGNSSLRTLLNARSIRWVTLVTASLFVYFFLNSRGKITSDSSSSYATVVSSFDSTQREQLLLEVEDPFFLPNLHITTTIPANDLDVSIDALNEELFADLSFAELIEASSSYLSADDFYELLPSNENVNTEYFLH